jgi:hypothetical protein
VARPSRITVREGVTTLTFNIETSRVAAEKHVLIQVMQGATVKRSATLVVRTP